MAQQEKARSRVWLWTVPVVVIVGVLFYIRSGNQRVTVRVATATRQDISRTSSTNGKVVPSVDFQAHAPSPGEVKELYVTLNEKVRAGQSLLRLDDAPARRDVAAAVASLAGQEGQLNSMQHGGSQEERIGSKADLDSALLQQKQAANSLDTTNRLFAQGAASQNEVSSSQQRLNDANIKLNQLQTRRTGRYSAEDLKTQQALLTQARSSLASAQAGLASVDVKAPFSGTVYAIPVSQYDFVQGGEALLDVADLSKLEVLAYFDEPDVGRLAIGQPVEIVWEAKPNTIWHGHILEAPTTIITYGTRNVGECLITVDDAHGDLLPNTNVTVKVTTMMRKSVLTLPHEALHTETGTNNNYVYRIVGEQLVKTPVQVGVVNPVSAEITSGLKEGDEVALNAITEGDLSDGLRIKVAH